MRRFVYLTIVLLAVISCTREDFSGADTVGGRDAVSKKIVNEPSVGTSDVSSLLIYVEDASEEELDALKEACGAISVTNVFSSTPGKEELERSCGLPNWYKVNFKDGADIRGKALTLASEGRVQTVEYNVRVKKCYEGKPRQFVSDGNGGIAVKSISATKFNDPSLSRTSMACPHVSGVAALGLSYALKNDYHYTNDEFKSLLLTSVSGLDDRIGSVGSKVTLVGYDFGTLKLYKYKGKMGTGAVDAWRLFMAMDGVPSIMALQGQSQRLDVSGYFGENSGNLTYISVETLDDGADVLGLAAAPAMKYGKLQIHPTKSGCARLRIKAVGGGSNVTSDNQMGGMEITRVVSVIVRPDVSGNGGWL